MEITNEETKKCNDELERSNLKPTIRIVNSFGPIIQISIKTQEGKKTLSNISEDFKKCFDCGEIKRQDEFSNNSTSKDGKRHICKPCESIKNYSHRSTFDGFFSKLFSHAKEGAEKRRKKRRLEAGMIDITLEYLKGLWDKQDGKCFYS